MKTYRDLFLLFSKVIQAFVCPFSPVTVYNQDSFFRKLLDWSPGISQLIISVVKRAILRKSDVSVSPSALLSVLMLFLMSLFMSA